MSLTGQDNCRTIVEGETEFFAILNVLPEPSKYGIELVNLHGNLKSGKANVAMKLRDSLLEDKAQRRFSNISFDTDVQENVKFIRRQVEQGNIIGFIAAHDPDFEFSNFTVWELAEIAARIDETKGTSGENLRNADWTNVTNSKVFEIKYREVSDRKPRNLKGKEWGEALSLYAKNHPNREDDGKERPFWREIRASLQARVADYDYHKSHFRFNKITFESFKVRT